MASRDRSGGARLDSADFCVLKVQLSRKGAFAGSSPPQMHFMTVDNRMETLDFVQNNLDLCAKNILKLVRGKDSK
ncbi:hypothetical protein KOM00_12665 [Geomonas sp. Red69]|uniref:Uncharacterized protein n=2 Tax=Geomonas diazotrophica TaxID=2843197 RepID=A0ABX8JPU3_9BACT|nr:hypothetical protein [Geomonas diazotrophica]MBU5637581.1 hypothetical protein [Geomonas diazotrophica]QWV99719.1 hypothetical protein KP005_08500 [Geomonas nitrogeniifigens]QXE88854.1 hypothetical protein KP003_08750 [Geomonas nitrogeniifigens]